MTIIGLTEENLTIILKTAFAQGMLQGHRNAELKKEELKEPVHYIDPWVNQEVQRIKKILKIVD